MTEKNSIWLKISGMPMRRENLIIYDQKFRFCMIENIDSVLAHVGALAVSTNREDRKGAPRDGDQNMKFTRYLLFITVTLILMTGCFAGTSKIDKLNAVADLTAIEIREMD